MIHSCRYIEQTPPRPHTTHPETGERLFGLELSSPLSACLEVGPARGGDLSAVQALGLQSCWLRIVSFTPRGMYRGSGDIWLVPFSLVLLFMMMLFPAVGTISPISASAPLCHRGQQRIKPLSSQPQLALLDLAQSIWGG